jgi:hypothetical protein
LVDEASLDFVLMVELVLKRERRKHP